MGQPELGCLFSQFFPNGFSLMSLSIACDPKRDYIFQSMARLVYTTNHS